MRHSALASLVSRATSGQRCFCCAAAQRLALRSPRRWRRHLRQWMRLAPDYGTGLHVSLGELGVVLVNLCCGWSPQGPGPAMVRTQDLICSGLVVALDPAQYIYLWAGCGAYRSPLLMVWGEIVSAAGAAVWPGSRRLDHGATRCLGRTALAAGFAGDRVLGGTEPILAPPAERCLLLLIHGGEHVIGTKHRRLRKRSGAAISCRWG